MDESQRLASAFVPYHVPFAVARAEGAYLYTPEGRPILDAAGGAIVANIGHARAEVAEVAKEALSRLSYVVPTWATPEKAALVQRLRTNWLPPGVTQCSFVSGGSESVDAAVRLARQYQLLRGETGRWKVVGSDLSYHGVTTSGLAVGHHANRRAGFDPLLLQFPKMPAPYCLDCQLGRDDARCREQAADRLEEVFEREGEETIAAVIAEPVTGSAGAAVVPPPGHWKRVAEIARRHGALFIADEVMTGFGRLGSAMGIQQFGVVPDIMVGGKGLAGGYAAMGGIFATEAVVAPLVEARQELMFYTFAGLPVNCAIADKVLAIMEDERLVERVRTLAPVLRKKLARIEEHPNVAEVRGMGFMLGVEFVKDKETLERFPKESGFGGKVVAAGIQEGVFFYPAGSGPVQDAIMLGPPFTITETDMDLMVDALEKAIESAATRVAVASGA
jgi:adenosylmethionine-8-amino-7-oxononanoate aminotransferase